jgi:oligopeptide transport system substrate-binding protein
MFLGWSKMSRTSNNGPNSANFASSDYDELFLQMKTMTNTPKRAEIIRRMLALLERECPWIPLYHSEQYALYHGWLRNVKPMGMSVPNAKYYSLDAEARSRARREWNRPVLWPAFVFVGLLALLVIPGFVTFFRERQ